MTGGPAKMGEATHRNNFDLIRLFAALQVAVTHGDRFILDWGGVLSPALEFLPGVPVFFLISGFLIAASYERTSTIRSFARKRALRIFPALWACLAGTLLMLLLTGYLSSAKAGFGQLLLWLAAQATILQFYNPENMRHFGAGIVNPALWTVGVEIQFYFAMPFLAAIFHRSRALYMVLAAIFVLISAVYSLYLDVNWGGEVVVKLLGVSFIPWIAMFMVGNLAWFQWEAIRPHLEGKTAQWALVYTGCAVTGYLFQSVSGVIISGNRISILLFIPLAALVLSAAYTRPSLGLALGGNDISYGLYLWHMPVIGCWLYVGGAKSYLGIVACLTVTAALAMLSWRLIEAPALKRKSSPRVSS